MSATNQPLQELVEKDEFREDLYYRINAIEIELPPLRERKDDIPILVRHFLEEFRPGEAELWTVDDQAMAMLESYPWPGNVRELRNVIERVALLARGQTIRASDLGASLASAPRESSGGDGSDEAGPSEGLPSLDLDELERMAVEEALHRTGWHQGQASEILGVSPRTLHRKIKAFGLERPR